MQFNTFVRFAKIFPASAGIALDKRLQLPSGTIEIMIHSHQLVRIQVLPFRPIVLR